MSATHEVGGRPAEAGGGLVLGRYRLGHRIGSGGFGTVFAARDERLDRPVAVKVMAPGGSAGWRAAREALAAARLHHPGIVAVYDAGEDDAGRYLISELVRGRTLDELEADGGLSDRDVLRIGLGLAGALAHAHERGVVHRDVKPQNVIVPEAAHDPRGAAKLTDFGVAHLTGDEPLTRTGDIVGTLAYMAPEQAAGERVGPAADLYSLALVLYEGLAGSNPVRTAGAAATARRVGTVLPPLRRYRADLPRELCAALDRALAPDPEGRGSLPALTEALTAALPEVSDEGGTIVPHPLERTGSPRLRLVLARVLSGAAAGALMAAALAAAGEDVERVLAPAAGGVIAGALVAALPRAGWLAVAAAAVVALAGPRPDTAALVALAVAAPPLLLPRRGVAWSVPALAPALGLAGLSGVYPALAGRARGAWTRAALGAIGMWWLLLAEPALGRELAIGTQPGEAGAVVEALATSGALLTTAAWAAGALVLPYLVRGRWLAADVVAASAWAAALAGATAAATDYAGVPEPRGLVAGAIAAAVVAVIAARLADTVNAGT